jgi:DNA-3-methyladenine glycosylase I
MNQTPATRREMVRVIHSRQSVSSEVQGQELTFVFYSGFKAATVDSRLSVIRGHFPDFSTVAKYQENDIARIMADSKMIRNERKIRACAENARVFAAIIDQYGSFRGYIDSFLPTESFENLMLLKEELEYRFQGIGRVTTYHILTDIGLPVLKPDRVMCRIFQRLGLIESEDQLLKTVIQGRKFAEATGLPIRYIDIVFVAYGQAKYEILGMDRCICLEENPLCSACKVASSCKYFIQKMSSSSTLQ